MVIDPCIPADWNEFSVTRKWRGAEYKIHVTNPNGVEKGVSSIICNGEKVDILPIMPAGSVCQVEVTMG